MSIDTNHPESVYIEDGVENALKDHGYNADYNSINVLPQDPEYISFNLYLSSTLATNYFS
jgi:galactitol-specific phosphotransferase system IIB component